VPAVAFYKGIGEERKYMRDGSEKVKRDYFFAEGQHVLN